MSGSEFSDFLRAQAVELARLKKLTNKTVDLGERVIVLDAVVSNLERRLLSVDKPTLVLDHARALEKQAETLFDAAQEIRARLAEDREIEAELREQVASARAERMLCKLFLKMGVKRESHLERIAGLFKEMLLALEGIEK